MGESVVVGRVFRFVYSAAVVFALFFKAYYYRDVGVAFFADVVGFARFYWVF